MAMKLPEHWTDMDRALFLLDGAEQSLVDEFGAQANPNAMDLLGRYAERRDELRREAAELVTATGEHTSGKLVAVMVDELDALEARLEDAIVSDIVARNPGINEDDVRHHRATGELPERKA